MSQPISHDPDIPADIQRLFSFDHGPEYPFEYPPGYAEPITDPLPICLEDYELPESPDYKIPSWDLIDDIQRTADRFHQNHLSKHDYQQHGHYSDWIVRDRFGSWNNAIRLAGLNPRHPKRNRGGESKQ